MDASTRQREPQNYTVDLAFAHPIGAKVIREDDDINAFAYGITAGRFGCPADNHLDRKQVMNRDRLVPLCRQGRGLQRVSPQEPMHHRHQTVRDGTSMKTLSTG